jgi:hypothetical protein
MKPPLVLAATLAIGFALGACTVAAPTPTDFPTVCCGPTMPPSGGPSPTPRTPRTPSPTVPPITLPTPAGTAAAPCPTNAAGEPTVPPDAQLTGADGTSVTGELGSYTFCGTSADALPPKAANVSAVGLGSSAAVFIVMQGGWGMTGYRAAYWSAAEWQGDEIALANASFTEPAIATSFSGPPAGDWMLAVHVTFPASGDATYYWHVTVP